MDIPSNLLHNWDYVGRCYDVLEVDPFDPGAQSKSQVFFVKSYTATPDNRFSVPDGFDYYPASGGHSEKSTKVITSSYDFKESFRASVTLDVADVTGKLFSSTLSGSYKDASQRTGSQDKTLTFSDEVLNIYRIRCSPDDSTRTLTPTISSALQELPASYGPSTKQAFVAFFASFGTHFASGALMGGRAIQRLTIDNASYTSLLANEVDISAQASATFDVVKAGGKAESGTTISKQFADAVQNLNEELTWVGGLPQMFGNWNPSVADSPAPIQLELLRLSELLVSAYFPHLGDVDQRRQALDSAITSYLQENGKSDYSKETIAFGDLVRVLIDAKGKALLVAASSDGAVSLKPDAQDVNGAEWVVCEVSGGSSSDPISLPEHGAQTVGLKNLTNGLLLDAMWGQAGNYQRGDGLVACHGVDLSAPSARWSMTRADIQTRPSLVSNDLLRLQTDWTDQDGDKGYLMGGTDSSPLSVFSFGSANVDVRTLWRLRKVVPDG